MNDKMKSCLTPYVLMHSLFGLGLGLLLSSLFAGLATPWLGILLMIVAVVLDMLRKQ